MIPLSAGRRAAWPRLGFGHAEQAQHQPAGRSPRQRSAACTGGVPTATSHIGCSSRGGPGSTTTAGLGIAGGRHDEARRRPDGLQEIAPYGITACLRLESSTAAGVEVRPARERARDLRDPRLDGSSSTSARPWKRPRTSAVRSSAVGPRPPLVTTSARTLGPQEHAARRDLLGPVADDDDRRVSAAQLGQRSDSHGPLRVTRRGRSAPRCR